MTTDQTPTTYLLAISIGPVQEFIAASRKARDLWYGSEVLSQLSRTAAQSLQGNANGKVQMIFPAEEMVTDPNASVANKLLAIVTDGDPASLARDARAAVQADLVTCWSTARKRSNTLVVDRVVDASLLELQLADFVEWYASWLPFDPDETDRCAETSYVSRRKQVELLLAGRKALRDFTAAHGCDGLPKSSLDPSRETVLKKDAFEALDERDRRALRLKLNEQLDGVSMIKRLGGTNRIASVSRVAVDPLLRAAAPQNVENLKGYAEALADTELVEHFDTYAFSALANYARFPFDCQLFYDPDDGAAWKQEAGELDENASFALELFFEELKLVSKPGKPPAYMAVLLADGDKMGKAIGDLADAGGHVRFSEKLVTFADDARTTVKDHFGVTIYAGGDDVLAFLPLDTALLCANALEDNFAKTMEKALPDAKTRPTLSVGLAIGHYSDHLQVLLDRAREAEREAKKTRNSLAVSFTPRSGGTRIVSHSWNEGKGPVAERWWRAIEALRRDAIPDGAVYELGDLCDELSRVGVDAFPVDFVANEAERILDRKRTNRGANPIHEKMKEYLQKRLKNRTAAGQIDELRAFADELTIARRIMPVVVMTLDTAAREKWTAAGAKVNWLDARAHQPAEEPHHD